MLGFNPLSNQPISDISLPLITGSISATDGNDSATITAQVAISGSISATDGIDTATIYAQELVSGYINTTDSNDSATLTAQNLVSGSISATDDNDSATLTAQNFISGAISATDGTDTANILGSESITGSIDITDSNDTCDIEGNVGAGMDMHDGFTKRDIARAKRIDKQRREAEAKLIAARRADAESRKKRFKDLIDPPVVSKQQKNKVESKQEIRIDTPSVEVKRYEAVIANLDKQEQELNRAIALRKQIAATMAHLAILEAKAQAEQDDEEAILMLL